MSIQWEQHFSKLAQRTLPPKVSWLMAQALEVPGLISLAAGFVDHESLPHSQLENEIKTILNDVGEVDSPLQYGSTPGDPALRRMLIEKLCQEDGITQEGLDESNILLGSGSQQILYLTFEALLNEDDIVLMEAPTYFVVLGAVQTRGAKTVGINTDKNGLIPEALEAALQQLENEHCLNRVKILYLMSYSTNPQGIQLAEDRRQRILDILRLYQDKGYPILLLEDAAYRRLSFENRHHASIFSLQKERDLVLYTESFSKSLSPGLRAGFGIGPKPLVQKLTDIKGNHDFGSGNLSMQIIKSLLRSGEFDRHTERLRNVYAQKWRMVNEILKETMPSEASWITPTGGFYTWLTLPETISTNSEDELFQQAVKEKVLYVPGNLCYTPDRPESKRSSSMRLAFGMIDEPRLREGCRRLAKAIRHYYYYE